jgi:tRNA 5-methylaminomethyl-2-thiouridine biosynthesis bifunctional protein
MIETKFLTINEDGEVHSKVFSDIYWTKKNAYEEKKYVFVNSIQIEKLWNDKKFFCILELGFGAGINFLTTLRRWNKTKESNQSLNFISFEKFPISKSVLKEIYKEYPQIKFLGLRLLEEYTNLENGIHILEFREFNVQLTLIIGDIENEFFNFEKKVDVFYLDGFSPNKNSELWSQSIFEHLIFLSHKKSIFTTYSSAGLVKKNAVQAGFEISKKKGFGFKRDMLIGTPNSNFIESNKNPFFKLEIFNKNRSKNIGIIGAGLAGLSIAKELNLLGYDVTIYESESEIMQKGSGNPAGIFNPSLSADRTTASTIELSGLWNLLRIIDQLKNRIVYDNTGINITIEEKELNKFKKALQTYEIEHIFDQLNSNSFINNKTGWIDLKTFSDYLINNPRNNIMLNTKITNIFYNGFQWELIDQNKKNYIIDSLIIANAQLCNTFEYTNWIPIREVRGQIIVIPKNFVKEDIEKAQVYKNGYLIPLKNHQYLIGTTYDNYNISEEPREIDTLRILNNFKNFFSLKNDIEISKIYARAGIRATTPDHLPIVGPVPHLENFFEEFKDLKAIGKKNYNTDSLVKYLPNLYVFSGFGSKGLLLTGFLAKVLSNIIHSNTICIPDKLFHQLIVNRFLVKYLLNPNNKSKSWEILHNRYSNWVAQT